MVQQRVDFATDLRDLKKRVGTLERTSRLNSASIGSGNLTIRDLGSLVIQDGGNVVIADGGDINLQDGGGLNIGDGGDVTISGGGNLLIENGGDLNIGDGGDLNIGDGGNVTISEGGNLLIQDGGDVQVNYNNSNAKAARLGYQPNVPLPDLSTADIAGLTLYDRAGNLVGVFGTVDWAGNATYDGRAVFDIVGAEMGATVDRVDLQFNDDCFISDESRVRLILDGSHSQIYGPSGSEWFYIAPGEMYIYVGAIARVFADGSSTVLTSPNGTQFVSTSNGGTVISHTTTASAANCFISTGGLIQRSTSSRRYKTDIEDATVDTDAVLKMQPRTWRDKSEDSETRYIGFIAEELDELGLGQFVTYDEDGPEAISYDRLAVGLLEVLKVQQQQINELSSRLDTLTQR